MIAARKPWGMAVAMLLVVSCLAGCGHKPHGKQVEKGNACWYGDEYQGRRTASGETFNQHAFTAAHRSLPFGTVVLVKNLRNGKTVKVRINDRGPSKGNRIIDLSKAAAREIDMIAEGVVPVRIEVVRWGRRR